MAERNELGCSTRLLLVACLIASGTRFNTVSSDGEEVEDEDASVLEFCNLSVCFVTVLCENVFL